LLHARPQLHIRVHHVSAAEAADIALLGERMIRAGQTTDPDSCEPMYLQEFIVKQAKNALFPSSN
jgi:tRNA A37 threonylcarbamoyladenosine modification protein TsaB